MAAKRFEEESVVAGETGREQNGMRLNDHDYMYVRLLEDVSSEDLSLVGGKGANLGEMIRAGLPVPEGFVVLVDDYLWKAFHK